MLKKSLIPQLSGLPNPKNVIEGKGFRVTVITDRIFRIQKNKDNVFEDLPTQSIWYRDLGEVKYETKWKQDKLFIRTEYVQLKISVNTKCPETAILLKENRWTNVNNDNNLKGTTRTLDGTFGSVPLKNGLLSRSGVAVFNDSKSLVLDPEGHVLPRSTKEKDIYVFAYGKEYRKAIADFFRVSGQVPLIPRYALGNWWSRYRAYTQEEYLDLIEKFEKKDIPLSVATVDMDWHWIDLNKQFGTDYKSIPWTDNPTTGGWTGYSWNKDLFPDYRQFLKTLQQKKLKVTLNLHPADGIRWFEDMYPQTAKAMGIDPASKEDIKFDLSDDNFINNYFDTVHKPYEKEGVDFWWIDWQQGKTSTVPGLDPLWALNHYHFLDNAESGQLPLILSRYAGIGSHRYPLGFSGDTAISWPVLRFQPYFTANAANAGYTWWSHDIGGHHMGVRDDELYLRWIQFGVFSPVMRLHSTSHDLLGKEPWRYTNDVERIAADWLRLRHQIVPYLYTLNYRTHKDGLALCEPMYYTYPQKRAAYKLKNQYMFGDKLMVCPVTQKTSKTLKMARKLIWFPEGRWTDIFTGHVYEGGRFINTWRDITSIPVLAKEGAIIPFSDDKGNGCGNPVALRLFAFRGNGKFGLYEDNGKTDFDTHNAVTDFEITEADDKIVFTKAKTAGDLSVIPEGRNYVIEFKDIKDDADYRVTVNGKPLTAEVKSSKLNELTENAYLVVALGVVLPEDEVMIEITGFTPIANLTAKEAVIDIFSKWQGRNLVKQSYYKKIKRITDKEALQKEIKKMRFMPVQVKSALKEIFRNKLSD